MRSIKILVVTGKKDPKTNKVDLENGYVDTIMATQNSDNGLIDSKYGQIDPKTGAIIYTDPKSGQREIVQGNLDEDSGQIMIVNGNVYDPQSGERTNHLGQFIKIVKNGTEPVSNVKPLSPVLQNKLIKIKSVIYRRDPKTNRIDSEHGQTEYSLGIIEPLSGHLDTKYGVIDPKNQKIVYKDNKTNKPDVKSIEVDEVTDQFLVTQGVVDPKTGKIDPNLEQIISLLDRPEVVVELVSVIAERNPKTGIIEGANAVKEVSNAKLNADTSEILSKYGKINVRNSVITSFDTNEKRPIQIDQNDNIIILDGVKDPKTGKINPNLSQIIQVGLEVEPELMIKSYLAKVDSKKGIIDKKQILSGTEVSKALFDAEESKICTKYGTLDPIHETLLHTDPKNGKIEVKLGIRDPETGDLAFKGNFVNPKTNKIDSTIGRVLSVEFLEPTIDFETVPTKKLVRTVDDKVPATRLIKILLITAKKDPKSGTIDVDNGIVEQSDAKCLSNGNVETKFGLIDPKAGTITVTDPQTGLKNTLQGSLDKNTDQYMFNGANVGLIDPKSGHLDKNIGQIVKIVDVTPAVSQNIILKSTEPLPKVFKKRLIKVESTIKNRKGDIIGTDKFNAVYDPLNRQINSKHGLLDLNHKHITLSHNGKTLPVILEEDNVTIDNEIIDPKTGKIDSGLIQVLNLAEMHEPVVQLSNKNKPGDVVGGRVDLVTGSIDMKLGKLDLKRKQIRNVDKLSGRITEKPLIVDIDQKLLSCPKDNISVEIGPEIDPELQISTYVGKIVDTKKNVIDSKNAVVETTPALFDPNTAIVYSKYGALDPIKETLTLLNPKSNKIEVRDGVRVSNDEIIFKGGFVNPKNGKFDSNYGRVISLRITEPIVEGEILISKPLSPASGKKSVRMGDLTPQIVDEKVKTILAKESTQKPIIQGDKLVQSPEKYTKITDVTEKPIISQKDQSKKSPEDKFITVATKTTTDKRAVESPEKYTKIDVEEKQMLSPKDQPSSVLETKKSPEDKHVIIASKRAPDSPEKYTKIDVEEKSIFTPKDQSSSVLETKKSPEEKHVTTASKFVSDKRAVESPEKYTKIDVDEKQMLSPKDQSSYHLETKKFIDEKPVLIPTKTTTDKKVAQSPEKYVLKEIPTDVKKLTESPEESTTIIDVKETHTVSPSKVIIDKQKSVSPEKYVTSITEKPLLLPSKITSDKKMEEPMSVGVTKTPEKVTQIKDSNITKKSPIRVISESESITSPDADWRKILITTTKRDPKTSKYMWDNSEVEESTGIALPSGIIECKYGQIDPMAVRIITRDPNTLETVAKSGKAIDKHQFVVFDDTAGTAQVINIEPANNQHSQPKKRLVKIHVLITKLDDNTNKIDPSKTHVVEVLGTVQPETGVIDTQYGTIDPKTGQIFMNDIKSGNVESKPVQIDEITGQIYLRGNLTPILDPKTNKPDPHLSPVISIVDYYDPVIQIKSKVFPLGREEKAFVECTKGRMIHPNGQLITKFGTVNIRDSKLGDVDVKIDPINGHVTINKNVIDPKTGNVDNQLVQKLELGKEVDRELVMVTFTGKLDSKKHLIETKHGVNVDVSPVVQEIIGQKVNTKLGQFDLVRGTMKFYNANTGEIETKQGSIESGTGHLLFKGCVNPKNGKWEANWGRLVCFLYREPIVDDVESKKNDEILVDQKTNQVWCWDHKDVNTNQEVYSSGHIDPHTGTIITVYGRLVTDPKNHSSVSKMNKMDTVGKEVDPNTGLIWTKTSQKDQVSDSPIYSVSQIDPKSGQILTKYGIKDPNSKKFIIIRVIMLGASDSKDKVKEINPKDCEIDEKTGEIKNVFKQVLHVYSMVDPKTGKIVKVDPNDPLIKNGKSNVTQVLTLSGEINPETGKIHTEWGHIDPKTGTIDPKTARTDPVTGQLVLNYAQIDPTHFSDLKHTKWTVEQRKSPIRKVDDVHMSASPVSGLGSENASPGLVTKKTTTKQILTKTKDGIVENIEEKIEDGRTGEVTINTHVNKVSITFFLIFKNFCFFKII